MLILLVGLAFLITSFSTYAFTYQINGVNRVVVSTPITIFESSILHDVESEEPKLRFSRSLVKEKLEHYYNYELKKFSNKFNFDIYFYNKNDESMCVEEECDAVEIAFNAYLIFNYKFNRTIKYAVAKGYYGS